MTTHEIKGYTVEVSRLHQSGGASPFYCSVYKAGKRLLAVTVPEADTPSEAARIAVELVV